jgi:hypothetical protein
MLTIILKRNKGSQSPCSHDGICVSQQRYDFRRYLWYSGDCCDLLCVCSVSNGYINVGPLTVVQEGDDTLNGCVHNI